MIEYKVKLMQRFTNCYVFVLMGEEEQSRGGSKRMGRFVCLEEICEV